MQLLMTSKDLYSNTITFTLIISPVLNILNSLNFSEVVSSTLLTISLVATYSDGTLIVHITYTKNIQNSSAVLSIAPPTSFGNTFDMKASSTSFIVNPSNAEAYYYDDKVYSGASTLRLILRISTIIALCLLVLSLGFWKMVGIELMHVLQTLFFAVSFIATLPPTLAPIAELGSLVNGYNSLFTNFPGRINFN
jgi:hypothetical protein